MPDNPTTASPVRPQHIDWAFESLLDGKYDNSEKEQAISHIKAYIAQLEASQPKPQQSDKDAVKHMVDRFLSWKLPDDFNPDGGVTFNKVGNAGTPYEYRSEPVGTNLLTAIQATAMVRHMLENLPIELSRQAPVPTSGSVESEAWPIMYQAAEDADATSGYGFPCWDDKIVAAGSDKVWAVAYAAGVASTQPPAADDKLREALEDARAGEPEIVIKAGGLWPGATGMRTNGPPENVICIPCGASQVRAKRALDALKATLAQPASGGETS